MNETKELLRRGVGDFEPTPDAFDRVLARRDRKRRTQRVAAGVLGIAMFALAAIGFARLLGSESIPAEEPAQEPSVDLGIFEPIAGRMIYSGLSRLWAVDLNAPSPVSTIVPLEVEGGAAGGRGDAARLVERRHRAVAHA